jgi:hypothetical protein
MTTPGHVSGLAGGSSAITGPIPKPIVRFDSLTRSKLREGTPSLDFTEEHQGHGDRLVRGDGTRGNVQGLPIPADWQLRVASTGRHAGTSPQGNGYRYGCLVNVHVKTDLTLVAGSRDWRDHENGEAWRGNTAGPYSPYGPRHELDGGCINSCGDRARLIRVCRTTPTTMAPAIAAKIRTRDGTTAVTIPPERFDPIARWLPGGASEDVA